jgi:predicted Zn-dependent peptidase
MKVLNTVLGGYFGSRLMTNIREDKGYTYGIGSAMVSLQNSGYFFIASEVGSDVTSDALKEVYSEITKLQNDLIPEDELMLVKNYMLGNFLRSLDGAFSVAENYKSLLEYGLNYDYYHRFVNEIREITPSEIRETARNYLDVSKLTELTVGS